MTGRAKTASSEIRKHKNAANPRHRAINPKNALARIGQRPHRRTECAEIYGDVRKTALESTAIVQMQPNLRITPVMQAEILRLYVGGHSLCEIARRTHRARQTVTKVVRAPDIQAMIQEQKEKLVAESDDWVESLNFVVRTELNGAMAYKLAKAFGIIPSPEKKAKPAKQNSFESVDPQTLARARELALEARRRAALPPLENDELEKLVQEDQVESNRKCWLISKPD